jgi:chaperonin GroEL
MSLTFNEPQLLDRNQLNSTTNKVLNHLYDILGNSYGPLGENTIIHRNGDSPVVTKDGLTILKSIRFEERQEFDIYRLIYSISSALVDKVGDGSTSAVISARNLFNELVGVRENYRNGRKFNKALTQVQEVIGEVIKLYLTREVSADADERRQILSQIAGVSNNNDFDIGAAIAQVMSSCNADSIIKIKDNPRENSETISYTTASGFSIDKYRLNHGLYFTGEKTKHGFEVDNALVFMTYNMLEVHYKYIIKNILPAMKTKAVPVIIIAETVQKEVADQITKDAFLAVTAGKIPAILLVETGGLATSDAMNNFIDLQSYVNANAGLANTITDTNEGEGVDPGTLVGYAVKTHFLPNGSITFENGAGYKHSTQQFLDQLKHIQAELDDTPPGQRALRGNLRSRLARMNGVTATIYVGGRTQEEKETTRFLVDDSVQACQSVLRNGYTLGSNLAPYYAATILFKLKYYSNQEEFIVSEGMESILEKLKTIDWNIVSAILKAYTKTAYLPWELETVDNDEVTSYLFDAEKKLDVYPGVSVFTIYNTSSERLETFDLKSGVVDTSVISPVSTDIEILNATFSIVTLLLTSNQYIS